MQKMSQTEEMAKMLAGRARRHVLTPEQVSRAMEEQDFDPAGLDELYAALETRGVQVAEEETELPLLDEEQIGKLEHELSAFRDEIAHGAGLSVLFPAWALYEMKNDFPRFAQLANRVFGVEMDFHHPERTAREGILTMKRFFEEIGMPTHLSQLGIKPENYAQLAANTVRTVKGPVKSYSALDEQAIIEIYKLAE